MANEFDRVKEGIIKLMRSAFPRLDYLAHYPGKVVAQAVDGSVDVRPDDPRLPDHQGVPIRYGVPGVTAKVSPGARCHLGFSGGDPQKPFVELWDGSSCIEIKLNGGSAPVARVGDPAAISINPVDLWRIWLTTVGTFTGAGPPPATALVTITSGAPTVKA